MAAPDSAKRIASFGIPIRGPIFSGAPESLDNASLVDAENMVVRRGVLRTRPGLIVGDGNVLTPDTGTPTGSAWYTNSSGQTFIVVGTTTGIYSFDGTNWVKRVKPLGANGTQPAFSGVLTGSLDLHRSRFTQIASGDYVFLLHTNGVDPMLVWDGFTDTFTTLFGDPVLPMGPPVPAPIFTDIATVGEYLIGLEPGVPPFGHIYDIRWSSSITVAPSLNQWPELNFRALSDTPDRPVAIVQQGPMGAVVYKTDSLYACQFVGGDSEAQAFVFPFRGFHEGPPTPAAIVNADGVHVYMSPTGRIASFDGSEHRWIADNLWPLLVEGRPGDRDSRLRIDYAQRIYGVLNHKFREVWFHYPRVKDTDGIPRGLVILSLPNPQAAYLGTSQNVQSAWPGHIANFAQSAPSTAVAYRMTTPESKVAYVDYNFATFLYRVDEDADLDQPEAEDAGEPFEFFWQTPLRETPGKDTFRLSSVEPFLERDVGYGALLVQPVRAYALENPTGTVGDPFEVNLEIPRVRPTTGHDIRGRWFGARFSFTPTGSHQAGFPAAPIIRYHGADVYGTRIE